MASIERVNQPLRGVNLGGWLVLERWLTPSLYVGTDAVDEFTLCQQMDTAQLRRLRKHHQKFITEADFEWLASHGIEAVRLPVGYWLFGDEAPYQASFQFVDKALAWAAKYNLKVLIDLHAAPGSQNGKFHSGRVGNIDWDQPANIQASIDVLCRLAKHYGKHPALLGISMLNEPWSKTSPQVLDKFYRDAYAAMQPHCHKDTWIVFSDGFKHRRWRRRLPSNEFPNLHIDHHHYQIFRWIDKLLPVSWQLQRTKRLLPGKLRRMVAKHPVVIGEWSLALRGDKQRGMDQAKRLQIAQQYGELQLQAMQPVSAWFYWTYKSEGGGSWSYQHCIKRGLIEID